MESMAGTVDYRRCIWADGHRLCRTYYEDEPTASRPPPSPDYGYYGAPGIYLGYGGFGGRSRHRSTTAKAVDARTTAIDYYAASESLLSGAVAFRAGPMSAITERARAKINLTLRVLGRRADGYHLLESLIAFADVGDDVIFEPGAAPRRRNVRPLRSAIAGSNLVDTALQSPRRRRSDPDPRPRLVDKQLPIAAGIGGGSADAAAVLRAVRRINPANGVDWERLAAALGADVSVCLADRSSLRVGRRRARRAGRGLPRLDAVLVCPQSAAPFGKTKSVFGAAVGAATPATADAARAAAALPRCCGAHRLHARRRQRPAGARARRAARQRRRRRRRSRAAARLPLRQPLRRRSDELRDFSRRSARRCRRRASARTPSRLVDRRHHARRLTTALARQQKKQLRQAVAASLICPLMIFEYSPSLLLKRSHTAFLASGWPCSVSHCFR